MEKLFWNFLPVLGSHRSSSMAIGPIDGPTDGLRWAFVKDDLIDGLSMKIKIF